MKLKVRLLKWSAGSPVAMLNTETAEKIGVHLRDRISIKSDGKKLFTIIDTVGTLVKKNEIAVSTEIKNHLGLRKGQSVEVDLASAPESLNFIKNKLNKKSLSKKEIMQIIEDVVSNSLSESEIALFISAMYKNGMNFNETIYLVEAMLETGDKLTFGKRMVVDKHCIGGVAGNRTTPLVVSICAAAGLTVPKTSSRAITSAAGTADVIEAIANVEFSNKEIKKLVKKTGACMIWGGSLKMAPADDKIIVIEKQLKIDPEAQLLASIMSKKLAMGAKCILIDIPFGDSAKVTKQKGLLLKKKFEKIGKHFNKKMRVVLTDASEPIGFGVGPILELIDVINILDPEKIGPSDLEEKSIFLSAQLLEISGKAKKNQGEKMARQILHSGKAFKKFKEIIGAQGGKVNSLDSLSTGKFKKDFFSHKKTVVKKIDNQKINSLARVAGCPADKKAGVLIHKKTGTVVNKGEKIITIYAESKFRLREAINFYRKENPIIID